MYVKDLEMKSRYLEGECRRLGRLLQCAVAENQSLRLSLQKDNAFGASSARQESAVLLLGTYKESCYFFSLIFYTLRLEGILIQHLIEREEMGRERERERS